MSSTLISIRPNGSGRGARFEHDRRFLRLPPAPGPARDCRGWPPAAAAGRSGRRAPHPSCRARTRTRTRRTRGSTRASGSSPRDRRTARTGRRGTRGSVPPQGPGAPQGPAPDPCRSARRARGVSAAARSTGSGDRLESTLAVSERYMDWVSTWVTPTGVAHAHASSRTATSGLDRRSARATWGRADIRVAGPFMPAPRLRQTRMRCHRTKDLRLTALE